MSAHDKAVEMLIKHIERFYEIQHNDPKAFNYIMLEFAAIEGVLFSIDPNTAKWWQFKTEDILNQYAEFTTVPHGSNPIQQEANRRQDELDAIQIMLMFGRKWIGEIYRRGVIN